MLGEATEEGCLFTRTFKEALMEATFNQRPEELRNQAIWNPGEKCSR